MTDLFVILTATYNRNSQLKELCKEVLKGKKMPFLHLIVNDGGEPPLIGDFYGEYSKRNSTLALLSFSENKGPSSARNRGLEYFLKVNDLMLSEGSRQKITWVQNFDSDDLPYKNFLSKKMSFVKDNPDFGVIYSDYDEKGVYIEKQNYSRLGILGDCIIPNNSMYRLDLAKEAGFYDEKLKLAEDWDFWIRLTKTKDAYRIKEPLYEYVNSSDGISRNARGEDYDQARKYIYEKGILTIG